MNDRRPPHELVQWVTTQRELALLLAHDLRNPLAAVLANLNFLELTARPDDTDTLEAISDIKLSTDVLLRLIENYVSLARLEAAAVAGEAGSAPGSNASPHPVGLDDAVGAAFERAAPAVRAAGIEIELVVRDAGRAVRGDRALIEQVVENLLGNVAQHVRRGARATLTVTREGLLLDDDGPPFGPAERDFTRDGQLELKKRSDSRYSRGLALYLVGLAARALGGSIVVRPGHGRGHLTVALPTE